MPSGAELRTETPKGTEKQLSPTGGDRLQRPRPRHGAPLQPVPAASAGSWRPKTRGLLPPGTVSVRKPAAGTNDGKAASDIPAFSLSCRRRTESPGRPGPHLLTPRARRLEVGLEGQERADRNFRRLSLPAAPAPTSAARRTPLPLHTRCDREGVRGARGPRKTKRHQTRGSSVGGQGPEKSSRCYKSSGRRTWFRTRQRGNLPTCTRPGDT